MKSVRDELLAYSLVCERAIEPITVLVGELRLEQSRFYERESENEGSGSDDSWWDAESWDEQSEELTELLDEAANRSKDLLAMPLSGAARAELAMVKHPGSSFLVPAPTWVCPETASEKTLRFPSLHHVVEFAAYCVVKFEPELREVLDRSFPNPEALAGFGSSCLVSIEWKNPGDEQTYFEERFESERTWLLESLGGFPKPRGNSEDELISVASVISEPGHLFSNYHGRKEWKTQFRLAGIITSEEEWYELLDECTDLDAVRFKPGSEQKGKVCFRRSYLEAKQVKEPSVQKTPWDS